jgi:hypothetical protein
MVNSRSMLLQKGTTLAGHHITGFVGRGGMGEV